MEAPRCVMPKDVRCPILCIVKATLIVLVAIFVLYLPLGDPEVHCATRHNSKDQRLAMCCICDLYMMAVKLCHKLLELIEFFISIFVDLLYEAKLRFYTFLEKIDGKDLCRSVCCFDEKDDPNKKEHRHRSCRCVRSKCKIK